MKHRLIAGNSTGMGRVAAQELATHGYQVLGAFGAKPTPASEYPIDFPGLTHIALEQSQLDIGC